MHSITRTLATLAWEYWRKSLQFIPALVLFFISWAFFFKLFPSLDDQAGRLLMAKLVFSMGIFLSSLMLYVNALNQGYNVKTHRMGFPFHQYLLPISTAWLVFCHMLFSTVCSVLVFSFMSAEITLLTGFKPPLLAPILIVTAVISWVQVLGWTLVNFKFLRLFSITFFILALVFFFSPTHGVDGFFKGNMGWGGIPAWQAALWALAIAVAYAAALAGVARDRRGEAPNIQNLKAWWSRVLRRLPQRRRPFASPQAALLWFEMRQKGWLMPVIALASLLIGGVCYLFEPSPAESVILWLLAVSVLILPVCALPIGMYVGRCYHGGFEGGMDSFRATRPLSDRALSDSILKTGALTLLIGWAICLLPLAIAVFAAWACGNGAAVAEAFREILHKGPYKEIGFLWMPLPILGAWALLGLGMLAIMAGHPNFLKFIAWFYIACLIGAFASSKLLEPATQTALGEGFSALIGGVILIATVWGYRASRRSGFIATWAEQTAHGAIFIVALAIFLFVKESICARICIAGLFALNLAPFALAPLAIRWNRHR